MLLALPAGDIDASGCGEGTVAEQRSGKQTKPRVGDSPLERVMK